MAAIIIGVVGVIACFVGLEFWWKADSELCQERKRRRDLQEQLRCMPTIPPLLNDDEAGGSAHLVVWSALTRPGIEVVCAALDAFASDSQMDSVELILDVRHMAPGRSSISRRPGRITLANGSRIVFRHANGRSDDRPFMGIRPDLIWWCGPGPIPAVLRRVNVSSAAR